MAIQDLIKSESVRQEKALAALEAKLGKQAADLQRELYELIRDKFLDSLQKDENGNIIYNIKNITRVNDMGKTWDYFRERSFRPEVLEFGKDLMTVVDIQAGYFLAIGKEFNIPFEFSKVTELISKQIGITLGETPAIIKGSYLDRLLTSTQIRDKVTNLVLENVSAKASFAKLKTDLETIVKGSDEVEGAMVKYLRTYAYDTFSHVQQAINLNIADNYGLNCFVYEGNIIKDSREFCREHLGQIICRDEFEALEAQDWQGKNSDVPFEISLGGYNCRHSAMWIPDEAKDYFNEV